MSLDMLNQQKKQLDHKINDLQRRCESTGDSDLRNKLISFIEVHTHVAYMSSQCDMKGSYSAEIPTDSSTIIQHVRRGEGKRDRSPQIFL